MGGVGNPTMGVRAETDPRGRHVSVVVSATRNDGRREDHLVAAHRNRADRVKGSLVGLQLETRVRREPIEGEHHLLRLFSMRIASPRQLGSDLLVIDPESDVKDISEHGEGLDLHVEASRLMQVLLCHRPCQVHQVAMVPMDFGLVRTSFKVARRWR